MHMSICVNHSFLRLAVARYPSAHGFHSTGIHLSWFRLWCCAIAVTCVRTPYACSTCTTTATCNQQINLQQPCRMLMRQGSLICVANLTASTDKAALLLLAGWLCDLCCKHISGYAPRHDLQVLLASNQASKQLERKHSTYFIHR